MIITKDDFAGICSLQHLFSQHFEMKDLGTLSYFLRLEVTSSFDGYYLSKLNMLLIFSLKSVSPTTRLFPLSWNTMQSSHPWMVNLYSMLLIIVSWLVIWSISLLLVWIFHMPWVWLVSSWMSFVLSTILLFFGFSDMSRKHFTIVSTIPLGLLLNFMLI